MADKPRDHAWHKSEQLREALLDPHLEAVAHGLDRYEFEALSLPEIDLDEVDVRTTLLSRPLAAPLLIGAMAGGSEDGLRLNRILAQAAARCGVGFCLGSQRAMLDLAEDHVALYQVRDVAPDALVIGNIGATQVRDHLDGPRLERLARAVGADAMAIHLNPLQEAIQPGGDHNWRGVLDAIGQAASECSLPVLVKEVGGGLGEQSLKALAGTGVAGIETAGVGGTSFALLEARRQPERSPKGIAGRVLQGFGTSTAVSLRLARLAFPGRVVIASGGLRHGLDVARCIALGADAAAMAWPLLKAASEGGVERVVQEIEGVIETLRIVMFLTGSPTLSHLAGVPFRDWA
jgi:isopentenyl-diphosphate delta-isomerase